MRCFEGRPPNIILVEPTLRRNKLKKIGEISHHHLISYFISSVLQTATSLPEQL